MVGICQEYESAMELMVSAYQKLQEKNPKHELLSLVELDDDKRGFKLSEKFFKRCLSKENQKMNYPALHAYTNYFLAMENASHGIDYDLPPKPKLINSGLLPTASDLEKLGINDSPF